MLYDGWAGGVGSEGGVPTLTPAEAVAPEFWAAHVAARRPAIVDGLPGEGWGVGCWTDDYLTRVAGDAPVKVEVAIGQEQEQEQEREQERGEKAGRTAKGKGSTGDEALRSSSTGGTKHPFGHGQSKMSTFGEVLRAVASGSEALYLTTQALGKAGAETGTWTAAVADADASGAKPGEEASKNAVASDEPMSSTRPETSSRAPLDLPPSPPLPWTGFGVPRSLPPSLPSLFAEPISSLLGDLPIVPAPFAGLCPQSINLWMGRTRAGTSSGLHHDFHDNLYVLVRGRKRFRLFPPNAARDMALRGELRRVHANGRPVYAGRGWRDVRADGSDGRVADAWIRRWEAECELQQEQNDENGAGKEAGEAKRGRRGGSGDGDDASANADGVAGASERGSRPGRDRETCVGSSKNQTRLSLARAAVAEAVAATEDLEDEELLEEVALAGGDEDGGVWDDLRDDFDDLVHEEDGAEIKKNEGDSNGNGKNGAKNGTLSATATSSSSSSATAPALETLTPPSPPPPSFSRVDPSWPPSRVRRECPGFPGWEHAIEVTLEAGQCLYLPAGWFHEVTSYSTPTDPVHLAVNFWFHPPDQAREGGRDNPYVSPYWQGVWAARRAGVLSAQARAAARAAQRAEKGAEESAHANEAQKSAGCPQSDARRSAPSEEGASGSGKGSGSSNKERATKRRRDQPPANPPSAPRSPPSSSSPEAIPRLERFRRENKASRSHLIAARRAAKDARAARRAADARREEKKPLPNLSPVAQELLRALLASGAQQQAAPKKSGGRVPASMFCLGRRRFLMG